MSATLYALVILQGTTLTFEPGYPTAAECTQHKGGYVSCFAYDPSLSTWTAFFRLPEGGFRTVGKILARTSVNVTSARLRTISPPLAGSCLCPSLVIMLPAWRPCSLRPLRDQSRRRRNPCHQSRNPIPPALPRLTEAKPSDIQVGGKQYTKVAGLTWVESKPDSFADVSVGPNDLQSKDRPAPLPPKTAERKRTTKRQVCTKAV